MKTSLLFSTILIVLFTDNISNAQCVAPASNFGNNSGVPSYNVTGDVTVTLNAGGQTITLDLGANFKTTPGPDVKVHLVKSKGMSNTDLSSTRLSKLEYIYFGLVSGGGVSPNGAKSFTVNAPAGTVIEDYDTVFFYCVQFNAFWDLGKFTAFSPANCSVLGVEESIFSKQITIYPNPVVDKLHINNSNANVVGIKIYSTLGKLLFEDNMSNKKTVNISYLSSGIYFMEISSGDKKLIRKIVKE